jgi:sulfite exporter TauE/SafE
MPISPEASVFSVLAFGFVLGLQHATEADHLAAVSTIVSEKKNLLTASFVGGLWGIGHTISLLVVGILVIFLKLELSDVTQDRLEACVGLMLVLLGLNVLSKLIRGDKIHVHVHEHEGHRHAHVHSHQSETSEPSHHRLSPRSVVVGMVHGLAGSGAFMLFVLPSISSSALAVTYIIIFGIGSIGGMMAMSFLIGLPFHFTAGRFASLNRAIRLVAGLFSLGLGFSIIYEKLIA